jgi:hypothetical protein
MDSPKVGAVGFAALIFGNRERRGRVGVEIVP